MLAMATTDLVFKIVSFWELTQLVADAQAFYSVHAARTFLRWISRIYSKVLAVTANEQHFIEDFGTLIVATPADASEGYNP
jgi:nucleoside-diphosphate kinase